MAEPGYDAFISYNSNDINLAKQIAEKLQQEELKIWFDKKQSFASSNWPEEIAKGISQSKAMIILIGPSGLSNWQKEEVDQALAKYIPKGLPIIPVILPGVQDLKTPDILVNKQRIDCRNYIPERSIHEIIRVVSNSGQIPSVSKVGEDFSLTLIGKHKTIVKMNILRNVEKHSVLRLSWETFGFGMERLKKQMADFPYHLDIDAYFGIDDCGLVMATILNSSKGVRTKIGYAQFLRRKNNIFLGDASIFPELNPSPTIMVTDIELRTGKSLEACVKELRKRYDKPSIYFATFAALTKDATCHIENFTELVSAERISILEIEAYFMAFTAYASAIELPLGLS